MEEVSTCEHGEAFDGIHVKVRFDSLTTTGSNIDNARAALAGVDATRQREAIQ
jgi:hypothetical protein